jgi:ParB/RepB/Spo0J family partition protein
MSELKTGTVAIELIDVPESQKIRLADVGLNLEDLLATIPRLGLLNPIVVKRSGERFELVNGGRRLEACKRLGHQMIRATLADYDEPTTRAAVLLENVARSNLTAVEEAAALPELMQGQVPDVATLCTITGRSRGWVESRLAILDWPSSLQLAVHRGELPLGAAQSLAEIPNEQRREHLIASAVANGINAATARYWLQQEQSTLAVPESQLDGSTMPYPVANAYETRAKCLVCNEAVKFEDLQRVNMCAGCLGAMLDATRGSQAAGPGPVVQPPQFGNDVL